MNKAIGWMARNGVAANLLMLFLLVTGLVSLVDLEQEVFPQFTLDIVEIRVPYPGGSPEEVEDGIVERIEERLEGLEGIKQVTSIAAADQGVVRAELEIGEDTSQRLDEIKAEIDRITTFPEAAEEPIVQELTNRQRVLELAIAGDADLLDLKRLAYRVEDELSAKDEISFVQVTGAPDFEVSIEVSRDALRAHGLTLQEVASIVRQSSLDLPVGEVETGDEELALRIEGQRYVAQDFEDIVVTAGPAGDVVRLREISNVEDAFADVPLISRFNGDPVVYVQVFRTGSEQVLEIADVVESYVDEELRPTLPPGVEATLWQNDAQRLRERFELLIRNALIGLLLVALALTLFLDIRLALWTAAGILVAFVGTFAIMRVLDVSINMLSLFGFILAIGIVVDDAIVVGENVFTERQRSTERLSAAIRGARRVARPVIFAVTTTIIAFVPLLFVPGTAGKFLGNIPVVVISVLVLSLIESLLVLPHHLGKMASAPKGRVFRFFSRIQARVDGGLQRFIEGPLHRALSLCTRHPFVVLSAGLAVLMVTATIVFAGYVRIIFFPEIESDYVSARIEMPSGVTEETTLAVARYVAERGHVVAKRLEGERDEDEPTLVRNVAIGVGTSPIPTGSPEDEVGVVSPSTATVIFQLSDPEERELKSSEFEAQWREAVGEVVGVQSLTFSSNLVDFGADVQVELSVPVEERLPQAVSFIRQELERIDGVIDVRDDLDPGKRELQMILTPTGRAMGLTLQDLALQLRAGFFGVEAERVQRGPEEVRVYVRLPAAERDSLADVYDFRIRVPGGEALPLREVASIEEGRAPTTISRRSGRRISTVSASVDPAIVTGQEVTDRLREAVLPELVQKNPGLDYEFGGEQREQRESVPGLMSNFGLAMLAIYCVLAISFVSYGQPLVVMAAIPFGFVGAIVGHLVMGLDVSMLSMFGLVGLSGVIVNDSLVLIDFVNERLDAGEPRMQAIIEGAKDRFRPILLTSLTTFLGVFPIVIEQSLQAQFLVPLAVSMAFGILLGTVILMLIVTSLAEMQLRHGGRHGPERDDEEEASRRPEKT